MTAHGNEIARARMRICVYGMRERACKPDAINGHDRYSTAHLQDNQRQSDKFPTRQEGANNNTRRSW